MGATPPRRHRPGRGYIPGGPEGGRPRHGFKVLPAHPGSLLPRDLFRSPGGKGGESGVGVFDGAHGDAVVVEGLKKGPGNQGRPVERRVPSFSSTAPMQSRAKGEAFRKTPCSPEGVDPGTKGPSGLLPCRPPLRGSPGPRPSCRPLGVDKISREGPGRPSASPWPRRLPSPEGRPVLPRHIGVLLRRVAQRVAVIRKNPPASFPPWAIPPVTCAPRGRLEIAGTPC